MRAPPAIATYVLVSGNAPHRWIAEFVGLPMNFRAATEQIAIATAEDWWEKQSSRALFNERKATPEQLASLAKARAARGVKSHDGSDSIVGDTSDNTPDDDLASDVRRPE